MSQDLSSSHWRSDKSDSMVRGEFDDAMDAGFSVVPIVQDLFIAHGDWMRRTYLTIGRRSSELRALDDAILRADHISVDLSMLDEEMEQIFQKGKPIDQSDKVRESMEREAYRIVKRAFENWAKSEGDWRNCRRNYDNAPLEVWHSLQRMQVKYPDLVPDASLLATNVGELTATLFRDVKVQVRGADFNNVMTISGDAVKVGIAINRIESTARAVEEMLRPHFGGSVHEVAARDPLFARELMKVLPGLTQQIQTLVQMLPGIQVATSTFTALKRIYDVHQTDCRRSHVMVVRDAVPKSDAREALEVINKYLAKYSSDQKKEAALDATVAATSLLAILVPGAAPASSLVGAARSIAATMNIIVDLGAQYRDKQRLEEYLTHAKVIDTDIFAICPLVGAYYVFNVPFSIFSVHLVPLDSPTFLPDTEYLRESGAMKSVFLSAEQILDKSKFVLTKDGLPLRCRESMHWKTELFLKAKNLKRRLFS